MPNVPRSTWTTTNNVGFLDVPANLQHGTGFTSVLSNTAVSYDTLTRAYFHADGTSYFHAGGEHQVKFGMQYDRVGENIASGELRPRVTRPLGHGAADGCRPARHLRLLLGPQPDARIRTPAS